MSKERELLKKWVNECMWRGSNMSLLEETKELLSKPERDKKSKVDFQTLTEMGLKRLQVSDNLVLQESCAKSPTLIFAENGNEIEIINYNKLLEIRSFIDEILNYEYTPPKREPLSKEQLTPRQGLTEYKKGYARAELDLKHKFLSVKQAKVLWKTAFKSAVPYYIFDEICVAIEQYQGVGVDDDE